MDLDTSMPITAPGNLPFSPKICELLIDLQVYSDTIKTNPLPNHGPVHKNKLSPKASKNTLPKRRHSWCKEEAATEFHKRQESNITKNIDINETYDDSTLSSLFTSLNNEIEFTLEQHEKKSLEDVNNNHCEPQLVKKSDQQIVSIIYNILNNFS